MNGSRQMDRTIEVGDREAALSALLPRRARRVLLIGRGELALLAADLVAADQGELIAVEGLDKAPGGAWDAVLLAVADGAAPRTLERARTLLATAGRLAILLPDSDEAGVRRQVRSLSENGFVVLKEISAGPLGRALVTRRDDFVVRSIATVTAAARNRDAAAIEALFAASFPHARRTAEHWRWKYHESPWGGPYASLAFSPTSELTTHYAGYPVPFWRGDSWRRRGRVYNALHMGDTMTAPSYRRVGRGTSSLLGRAVRHFFACHRGQGLGFFYGFNTGAIQRFCGWFIGGSRVEPVAYRALPLDRRPGFSPAGYTVEAVGNVDQGFDRLFSGVAPSYRFLVQRDSRYVDWRYLRCPDADYRLLAVYRRGFFGRRLAGWGAFRRQDRRLLWGDALFDPRHARGAEALLAFALELPELAGTSEIVAWFPARPAWWHAELERLGFAGRPHPQDLAFMILPDADPAPAIDELYYTMGDGDLF